MGNNFYKFSGKKKKNSDIFFNLIFSIFHQREIIHTWLLILNKTKVSNPQQNIQISRLYAFNGITWGYILVGYPKNQECSLDCVWTNSWKRVCKRPLALFPVFWLACSSAYVVDVSNI